MEIFEFLRDATKAGLIQWKPTGEEVETSYGHIERGYETTIDGYSVKTVVRIRPKGFFKQGWGLGEFASGITIEKDGETLTLTNDPETIPGQKHGDVDWTVRIIQQFFEEKDLITSLTRSLARLLYS